MKAEPALLLSRGLFLGEVLRRERVTEGAVRAAVREQGLAAPDEVEAVVLETDGSVTVVQRPAPAGADQSAFVGVKGADGRGV